jgi:hypothetical protein
MVNKVIIGMMMELVRNSAFILSTKQNQDISPAVIGVVKLVLLLLLAPIFNF